MNILPSDKQIEIIAALCEGVSIRATERLTNGFSKKLENHIAAFGLHAAYYNFCRVHETLRMPPAMQLGIADHIWTVGELIDAALTGEIKEPTGRKVGRFTVIDGGVS